MYKILVLTVSIFLVACSHASSSLNVMDVSKHFNSTEYHGELSEISTSFKQKFRSYKNADVIWSTYVHTPRLREVFNLRGKLDSKSSHGVMHEKIYDFESNSKMQMAFWRNLQHTTAWPDNDINPVKATLISCSKNNLGQIIDFALIDKDKNKEGKALQIAQRGLWTLFNILTIPMGENELKKGETEIYLGDKEAAEKTVLAAIIAGETIWNSRPSIKLEFEGITQVTSEENKDTSYDVNLSGYLLIDKYTGSTVLLDMESELDSKHWGADLYIRNILEVTLDPTTPFLTDHFAQRTQKAAQL
ncbi:hypothetical protein [Curvivirga sp.]|uniref:hypothetical protein n=1 Tax=Curvivirga sp. TaxID=2856848 RepID=UPI003B5CB1D8